MISIRRATKEDHAAFLRLWQAAQEIQRDMRPFAITIDEDEHFTALFRSTVDEDGPGWLAAEDDGRVVGMAHLELDKASRMSDEIVLELSRVAVDPGARGRGVGRAIVAESERIARERGVRFLSAKIFARNEAAVAFWASLGFESWVDLRLRKIDD